jgi:peptide/nickel transport system permease protein
MLASVIANEKPLYVKLNGENLFPALSVKGYAVVRNPANGNDSLISYSTVNWKEINKDAVWCPVTFSPGKSDHQQPGYAAPLVRNPGGELHLLGTNKTGADVFSGIIHGARISLTVGILSMLIAGIIGIIFGSAAGFFGDHRIKISRTGIWTALILGLPLVWFYGLSLGKELMRGGNLFLNATGFILYFFSVSGFILFTLYQLGKKTAGILGYHSTSSLLIDQFVSRGIEVFNSVPRIVLIITISAISRPSLTNLILIIGLTSWTEIARLVRAEMLWVRESEFMQAADASGITTARQIFRHALPNVILPGLTAVTLGVASAILTESALSFLGIGVPANVVTWGSMLNEGRQNFDAWWLVAFPGLAIFTTVLAINIAGDALSETIDPKRNN